MNEWMFYVFQLDAGSPEKVCLMSRDQQTVLLVSYADLKQCFESAYNELIQASQISEQQQQQQQLT